jgi:DNA-binding transcriptional LysR family regulator
MNEISLQQIEIFLTVANCQSISRASSILYVAQPSVSNRIREMEETLGLTLFYRTNRGVSLTEDGVQLYARLDKLYNRFRISMNNAIRSYTLGKKPALNIGCLHMAEVIAAKNVVLDRFSREHPDIDFTCEYYDYYELVSKLRCRELDFIFSLSFDVDGQPDLGHAELFPTDSYFLIPQRWNFEKLTPESAKLLADETLLLELNNGYENSMALCRQNGFRPKEVRFVGSFLEILSMICAGEGFSVGGKFLPLSPQESTKIKTLLARREDPSTSVQVSIAWRDNQSDAVAALVETSREIDYASLPMLKILDSSHPKWYSERGKN